jgi:hypothetical protein
MGVDWMLIAFRRKWRFQAVINDDQRLLLLFSSFLDERIVKNSTEHEYTSMENFNDLNLDLNTGEIMFVVESIKRANKELFSKVLQAKN